MGKYRVNFKKQENPADKKEYGIIVEADSLERAEELALSAIQQNGKGFLRANDIIKIEQIA